MNAVRLSYRLGLFVFFAGACWYYPLRNVLFFAKWGALALILANVLRAPDGGTGRLGPVVPVLCALFLGAGAISMIEGVSTGKSLPHLISVFLVLLASAQIGRVWGSEPGRGVFLSEQALLAKLIAWTSFPMLLAGINLGRTPGRFSGWADNPNSLGMMLALLLPVALQRALHRPGWRLSGDRVLLLMMVAVLVSTGSRAAVLGALTSSAVILVASGRLRAPFVATMAVLGLFLYVAGDTVAPMLRGIPGINRLVDEEMVEFAAGAEGSKFKASGREAAWAVATQLVEEKPLGGYGWGAETVLLAQFEEELKSHQGGNVHNSYLSLLLQVGYLGALPILLLFAIAIFTGVRDLARSRSVLPPGVVPNTAVLLGTVVGALVHAVFESWLFATGNHGAMVFWPTLFLLLRSTPRAAAVPMGPADSSERRPRLSIPPPDALRSL